MSGRRVYKSVRVETEHGTFRVDLRSGPNVDTTNRPDLLPRVYRVSEGGQATIERREDVLQSVARQLREDVNREYGSKVRNAVTDLRRRHWLARTLTAAARPFQWAWRALARFTRTLLRRS